MLPVSNAEESTSNIKDLYEAKPRNVSPWLNLSSKNTRNHASLHHDSPHTGDMGDGEAHSNRHWDELKTQSGSREKELNLGRNPRSEMPGFVLESRIILGRHEKCHKGFMPYKKFIAENSKCATLCSEDSREKQRIRLCL